MMTKSLSKFVAMLAAASVLAGIPAFAAEKQQVRRKTFFESLFGYTPRARQPRSNSDAAWWQKGDDNGVRVIKKPKNNVASKPKKRPVAVADVDPEVSEGIGMGNLTYVPPKLEAVYSPAPSRLSASAAPANAVRLVLADKSTPIRAVKPVKDAVLAQYERGGFAPLWISEGKVTERGKALVDMLARANEEGLDPKRYLPLPLTSFTDVSNQLEMQDGLSLAQFDVALSVAAVTYARHISGGAFEPERLSGYNDIKPETVDAAKALNVLAFTPFPDAYLKSLAPTHPAYAALKAELAKLADQQDLPPAFAEGKRIKTGQKDPRVAQLRDRLVKDGYIDEIDAFATEDTRDVLDKGLAKALKSFQEAKGIPQTSALDSLTIRALNGPDSAASRDKLAINMERLRWLPRALGERHVFVNQAAYSVDVMDKGTAIWTSKVIVGRPTTQTAVFSDEMETVVFNPTWGVPASIILNEYLPKLRRNPGYLDKIGFKVVNASGKVVSSRSVNWNSIGSSNLNIGIQQPAGSDNALGEIKFLFPNTHSIYMHDTPSRHLFAESKRAFSHGCVRVENPREFAQVLLGWDSAKIDASVESGESKAIALPKHVPVHLTYFTAWPGKDGEINYYSDFYERDLALLNARKLMEQSPGSAKVQVVVEKRKTAAIQPD